MPFVHVCIYLVGVECFLKNHYSQEQELVLKTSKSTIVGLLNKTDISNFEKQSYRDKCSAFFWVSTSFNAWTGAGQC